MGRLIVDYSVEEWSLTEYQKILFSLNDPFPTYMMGTLTMNLEQEKDYSIYLKM
jgi:hypothetical protein